RQIRWTVLRLSPQACAIARVLQWVASGGFVSSVRLSTASTAASVTVRGAPGRGSSSNPSRRLVTKRVRHLPTVCFVSRRSCATRVLLLPAAQLRISRARCASACAVLARRVQRSKVSRSSAVIVTGGIGRPVRIGVLLSLLRTPDTHNLFHSFLGQDTSKRPARNQDDSPRIRRRRGRLAYPSPNRRMPTSAIRVTASSTESVL